MQAATFFGLLTSLHLPANSRLVKVFLMMFLDDCFAVLREMTE